MKPNKFLGQNFLTSKKIVEDIVRVADLKPDDVVLEVGPGKGILTEALLGAVPQGKVIAVEKDKRLVEYLNTKFKSVTNLSCRRNKQHLVLINDDILKFNFPRSALLITRYIIVANIPYYITSHFLRKFLESDPSVGGQPSRMVLMVQKEVGERIIARSTSLRAGKESILSISVKAYGEPKIVKKVPARYFHPKPKVDSVILLIDNISKDFFKKIIAEKSACLKTDMAGNLTQAEPLGLTEKSFFDLIKRGFSQKRKLLKNNLKLLNTECLIKCGIPEKARAEELSLKDWCCLSTFLGE